MVEDPATYVDVTMCTVSLRSLEDPHYLLGVECDGGSLCLRVDLVLASWEELLVSNLV